MSSPAAAAIQDAGPTIDPRAPRRVRHEARRRTLDVKQVDRLTPHMIRVTLTGDLEGFTSLGFDDHVKLFFPDGTTNANGATADGATADGATADGAPAHGTPADGAPVMLGRDFTPRSYDPAEKTLAIDFAIHDAGPATQWAAQARPGQTLVLGGPRGSFIIPAAYDWHLLIGDETALPAIGRRLAELPTGTRVVVIAEVDGPVDEFEFETKADATVIWAHRNGAPAGGSDVLAAMLQKTKLPAGSYYAWVACESLVAKALRVRLIAEHGANPKWLRAAGYWRRGAVAVHDMHDG